MPITHVWIEEGCCLCDACPTTAPLIFFSNDDSSAILGNVRIDGRDGDNREEKSPLVDTLALAADDLIREAAEGCPLELIKFSETTP